MSQEPRVSYLTTDHLGSPRVATDERGVVVKRSDFQPYGEEVYSVERTAVLGYTAADSIRQKFTGYERDIESGLDFAQARYYNSSHGRFTSVDPLTASATIRNPQTLNRYSYALNSPYKFTDPLGLLSQYTTGACGGSCPNSESRWTQSSGGPMTAGGVERPFDAAFAAMATARYIHTAIANLETYASNIAGDVQQKIKAALNDILRNGNAAAKNIAATIINSQIQIAVLPTSEIKTSAATDFTVSSHILSASISAGEFSIASALNTMVIQIRDTELSSAPALQGNLIHEGEHAIAMAEVLHSMSVNSNRSLVLDKSRMVDGDRCEDRSREL